MEARHHIDPSEDDTVIVDIAENRTSPERLAIEARARELVYRTLWAEFLNGNTVSHDQIELMIQRTIKDMGG